MINKIKDVEITLKYYIKTITFIKCHAVLKTLLQIHLAKLDFDSFS